MDELLAKKISLETVSVLIVEDDDEISESIIELLKGFKFFHKIVTAKEGAEAVRKSKNQDFDFFIIDALLPVVSGIEVVRSIRDQTKTYSKTPILFISGHFEDTLIAQAREVGVKFFLSKPFGEADFVDKVNLALENKTEKNQIQKDPSRFCRIPLKLIKKHNESIPFDLFLRLSDSKVVKISHEEEDISGIFEKYEKKGVVDIFAEKKDYVDYLKRLKKGLAGKFFDPSTTTEEKVETLDQSYQVAKEYLNKIGIDETSMEVAKLVAKKTQVLIKEKFNIFKFYNQFRNKCSGEYVKNAMVGFTVTCMIDQFEWKTETIKEKAHLAVTLRDIFLNKEDFILIQEHMRDPQKLPQYIFEHPIKTANFLSTDNAKWVPPEILTMIKQHHELPDGSGFPFGITHQKITLLAAIQIVADWFIEEMIKCRFDYKRKDEIIGTLEMSFNRGNFLKALDALKKMLKES